MVDTYICRVDGAFFQHERRANTDRAHNKPKVIENNNKKNKEQTIKTITCDITINLQQIRHRCMIVVAIVASTVAKTYREHIKCTDKSGSTVLSHVYCFKRAVGFSNIVNFF